MNSADRPRRRPTNSRRAAREGRVPVAETRPPVPSAKGAVEGKRYGTRLRDSTLNFTFDGDKYTARTGDTAAAALLAAGVSLFGRSVKARRPRGVFTAGPEEPCALLTVGQSPLVIPNVPATTLVLREGMVLRSQNRWPSLRFDFAALLQFGGGLFTAGFYYKTFFWPTWRVFEPIIRHLAGLGEAPGACALSPPAIEHLSCDLLVVGGGPAGVTAALAAARAGAAVVVCEREPVCGGELEFEDSIADGMPAYQWLARSLVELRTLGARLLCNTTVVAEAGDTVIAHAEPGGLPGDNTVFRIRAGRVLSAVGALEQPIAFIGNDLPGVMLLGAAERYAALYGVRPRGAVVLFGNHHRLYAAALRLRGLGANIVAVVDTRVDGELLIPEPTAAVALAQVAAAEGRDAAVALLRACGIACYQGHTLQAAHGWRGIKQVQVAPVGAPQAAFMLDCESLLVSGGWSPQRGLPNATAIGAAAGHVDLASLMTPAYDAGLLAAAALGFTVSAHTAPEGTGDPLPVVVPYLRSPAAAAEEKRQFIDLQNDVTVADLRVAIAEGFTHIEHVKRYTTLGIGTEQGRTSNTLGAGILAELRGLEPQQAQTSRARPPLAPMTLNSIAGQRTGAAFRVSRHTPLHDWHAAHGGVLDPMGLWLRPRYYRANGRDAGSAAVVEAARVRATGGIADCSTLGKIEIVGPDAAAFLDEIFLTRASALKVGRARYMVQLREDGLVLDDGLLLRVDEQRFLATTSSSHGLEVLSHLEHHLASAPGATRAATLPADSRGCRLSITDVTDSWAVIAVAGPSSRPTLQGLLPTVALDRLSHMAFIDTEYAGHTVRVLRAGFSGELAFELYCPPVLAAVLWQALLEAGLAPYGIDALDILRVEKGYLTTAEINGQVTPLDLGMQAMVGQGNACIGQTLLARPAFHEEHRPCLVGLQAADGRTAFLAGAQIALSVGGTRSMGYVTSSVFSPTLDRWVGLALVARNHASLGTTLWARDPLRGGDTAVCVVSPVHVDPEGLRMKGLP